MKSKPCAFGYVRVSVDEEAGNNASIAAQAAAIRQYADRNDTEIVHIFEEANVSGHKLQRRQFDRMIALAVDDDRPVQMVIVYALSRFARRLLTQITSEHELSQAGVRLVSLSESFGDDANGRLMRNVVAIMNEKYALDASLFTRRDRRGNARAGYWNGGPVPFGYETRTVTIEGRKERRRLFLVEDEVAVVRKIYDLAERGLDGKPMGTRSIATHLNANGYTLRGRPFFHNNVDGILTREHYTGSHLDRTAGDDGKKPSDEEAIAIACPAIIAVAQRATVAAKRAKAAPRVTPPRVTSSPILLTGLATCGHNGCGCGLTIRTGKSGQYSYYACNVKLTAGAGACPSKAIRQDELDHIVVDALLDRVLQAERLKQLLSHVLERSDAANVRRNDDLARVRRERQTTEARIRRLYEVIEDGDVSVRDPMLGGRLAEHNQRLAQLSATERSLIAQLATGKRRIDDHAVERFGVLIRQQMASNPQFRRAYVQLLVSKIVVSDATIDITGSVAAMEAALAADHTDGPPRVPSFDREWCRLQEYAL